MSVLGHAARQSARSRLLYGKVLCLVGNPCNPALGKKTSVFQCF